MHICFISYSEYGRFVRPLVRTAEEALHSVDVILLCIDAASRVDAYTKYVVDKVATAATVSKTPAILLLNKVHITN